MRERGKCPGHSKSSHAEQKLALKGPLPRGSPSSDGGMQKGEGGRAFTSSNSSSGFHRCSNVRFMTSGGSLLCTGNSQEAGTIMGWLLTVCGMGHTRRDTARKSFLDSLLSVIVSAAHHGRRANKEECSPSLRKLAVNCRLNLDPLGFSLGISEQSF